MKLKSWGIQLNNQNIFQKRAAARSSEKFSIEKDLGEPETLEIEPEKPKGNIFQQRAALRTKKEENKFDFLDTLKDVGEQVASKGVSGAAGAYGNLLDTFGLQAKEGETLPGQEIRYSQESQVLDKLNRGEVPSLGELMLLSDDDILPSYHRLPTSKEIEKGIEKTTGIGEGKTTAGRIAGHGAKFVGEGAATGGGLKALATLGTSGAAGQAIREAGGPEGLASAVEIGGSILPSAVSGKVSPTGITRASKEAEKIAAAGRARGLSEKQIAPLIQGENKTAILSKFARKGTRTKKAFESIKEALGDSYNAIKSHPEARIKIANADQINLRKEFGQIRNELSKTLAPSPDREAALNFIEKSIKTLSDTNVTPEYLVNFWQDINKAVKWNSIQGGKKALSQLKEPLSNALKKASPQLAKDFELTNQLYSKYAQISKKLKPNIVDAFVNKGELIAGTTGALALAQGNPWILGGVASEAALRIMAREMLINPYFQNVASKLVTNFNSSSLKGVSEITKQAKEYLSRKHPKEDWSFLTED